MQSAAEKAHSVKEASEDKKKAAPKKAAEDKKKATPKKVRFMMHHHIQERVSHMHFLHCATL